MARPVAAAALTIVGGVFIALGGLVFAVFGAILAIAAGIHSGWFFIGLVAGLLTIVMGLLMLFVPSGRTVFGIVTIVFALLSLPFALGGFVIGFLLALIGGVLAILWKPREPVIVVTAQPAAAPPWT